MRKVFLDSSVLVAASASKIGASAFILACCYSKKIKGFVSLNVIGEARKNVNLKLDKQSQKLFVDYLKFAHLFFVPEASIEKIAKCEECLNEKDAPILAAVLESPASFLITLDRRHFLRPEVIKFAKPLVIMTPREFVLEYLRG